MSTMIYVLDLIGVAVFAVSGALTASRKQMDIIGFALIATVTGIGGGTIRDLVLDRGAVFWVRQPEYLWLCSGVALLVFFVAHRLESRRFRWLIWADAMGLALFAVIGASVANNLGAPPAVAVLMGVMSASFGGIIRDVLCAEIPLILRREIYITAAAISTCSIWTRVMPRSTSAPCECCSAKRCCTSMNSIWCTISSITSRGRLGLRVRSSTRKT